jgi:hypothetical protein
MTSGSLGAMSDDRRPAVVVRRILGRAPLISALTPERMVSRSSSALSLLRPRCAIHTTASEVPIDGNAAIP